MRLNYLEIKDSSKKVVLWKGSENVEELENLFREFVAERKLSCKALYNRIDCSENGKVKFVVRYKDKDRYNFPESRLKQIVESLND